MSDKSLVMAEAMAYIDDRFLEEAHPESVGLSRTNVNRRRNIRRLAAVACLCIVAIGVFRLSSFEIFDTLGGNMKPEANAPLEDAGGIMSEDGALPEKEPGNVGNSPPEEIMPPGSSPSEGTVNEETGTAEAESETSTEK
ncbi:MAG: hypothetical protein E7645_01950 [Ruminococcaceae bacterium]|nr:hypothetical protein [Oscillospiraceae bacterium]